jgi:hypothetical protein
MKYQIQKYNQADHSDRSVVAEKEGLMSDSDLQSWVSYEIEKQEQTEGYAFVPVPESHEWFKRVEPNVSVASAVADTSVQSSNTSSMEGEPVAFETVAQYELQQSQKLRSERFAAEKRLAENMAKLTS